MKPLLQAVPSPQRAPLRYQIGGAPLENHDRSVYQSTHSKNGRAEPPYTEAQAWAEVVRDGLA